MSTTDDWPTLGEELARKSLALIEKRLAQQQRGQITRRELWLVADALSEVMQGLAPAAAFEIVYGVRQMLKKEKAR
jgi:hypothetical protein